MKIHTVTQGSSAWLALRMGKPTASSFDKILTPTGKVSASQDGYLQSLIAELIMGHPADGFVSSAMERGKEMEAEAVSFYEFQNDVQTVPVGFITNDEETIGVSPDRLSGDDGLLEIKCPSPQQHVEYLLWNNVHKAYYPQLQGQLWIAERKWVDICSYHPEMPPAIVRVQRDEEFIAKLSGEVGKFVARLAEFRVQLDERGLLPKPAPEPAEFLTEEDAEAIITSKFGKNIAA